MSVANLTTARDALEAKIAALYTDAKPTYSVGGRSISWDSHRASLMDELDKLNQLIINRSGSYEIHTALLG